MPSSIVESYSSPGLEVRDQHEYGQYLPVSQRSKQNPERSKPKRQLVLAPAEGWFALLLLAVAVYCVVYSITSVGWVDHTFILYWSATAGLRVGLAIAKLQRLPQVILHLAACLIGYWFSVSFMSSFAFNVF